MGTIAVESSVWFKNGAFKYHILDNTINLYIERYSIH